MEISKTIFDGVILIHPDVYYDNRGSFEETWNNAKYIKEVGGIYDNFVQDNESISKKGVIRGFHWQDAPMGQSKLIRCVKGRIYDIVICIDSESENYGKCIGFELSGKNKHQVFIPKGYAHGFISLEDDSIVNYKVDQYWHKESERCISPKSVDLKGFGIEEIDKMIEEDSFIYSEKDLNGETFNDL